MTRGSQTAQQVVRTAFSAIDKSAPTVVSRWKNKILNPLVAGSSPARPTEPPRRRAPTSEPIFKIVFWLIGFSSFTGPCGRP